MTYLFSYATLGMATDVTCCYIGGKGLKINKISVTQILMALIKQFQKYEAVIWLNDGAFTGSQIS